MTFNTLLMQLVLFSCGFSLLRSPRLPRGWLLVNGGILAVLAVTFWWVPQWAGWISAAGWLVGIVIPLIGLARVNRLVHQERYRAAKRLAVWLGWLHPADGFRDYPGLLQGLELAQRGEEAAAYQLLGRYAGRSSSLGRIALINQYRLKANWKELLIWMQQQLSLEAILTDPGLSTYYLRALGETGDLDGLLDTFPTVERHLEKLSDTIRLSQARLYTLAFAGQIQAVQSLLESGLSFYSTETKQFWLATAYWMAGERDLARSQLQSLRDHSDPILQRAIDWRLSHPPRLDRRRRATLQPALDRILLHWQQESRYGGRQAYRHRQFYTTYLLIGLNLIVFVLETLWGGSENLQTLYGMGAMVPAAVAAGEWWRLVAATFLHYGVVHLLVNMLGLYVLGVYVEALLGRSRFLVIYFCCGVGSMLAIALVAAWMGVTELIGVGASGAIMGLLGVMAAILLKGWRYEKAMAAQKRLRLVVLIVGLQVVSDLLTPQVSITGHLSGLVLGFGLGLLAFRPSLRVSST